MEQDPEDEQDDQESQDRDEDIVDRMDSTPTHLPQVSIDLLFGLVLEDG